MRFTVIVLHLSILTMGLAQAKDFICPTCAMYGPNAQEDCENNFVNPVPVCEYKDQPQCIVYKNGWMFTRACASESIYQENFKRCKADPRYCQMGRCFTSGCLATLGEN
ncbi:uncharacterized protein LOC144653197 [Oculina patagonica]